MRISPGSTFRMYPKVPWMLFTGGLMITCFVYLHFQSRSNYDQIDSHQNTLRSSSWMLSIFDDAQPIIDRRPMPFTFPLNPPPTRLANLTHFQYTINEDICGNDDVFMLIFVGSHPRNTRVREVIRETLGNPKIDGHTFKTVFLFGHLSNPEWQKSIDEESNTHHDVVQGNFMDSYRNMSYRDIMALRWTWQFCSQAKYVLHVDDDVSLDIYSVTQVLKRDFNDPEPSSRLFMGCMMMMGGSNVHRHGKYEVSFEDYPAPTYEPFCSGWTYVFTPEMAYMLDLVAARERTFWLNDAFITGVLVGKLNIVPQLLDLNSTQLLKDMVAFSEQPDDLPLNYSLGYIASDEKLMKKLHRKYEVVYHRLKY